MDFITSKEAAEILGISHRRVQELILNQRLPAQMYGGTYLIKKLDIDLVRERKRGRPKKGAANSHPTKKARKSTKKAGTHNDR
jgi:excisionase family DNA binding protein